jgi:hypothetical protein
LARFNQYLNQRSEQKANTRPERPNFINELAPELLSGGVTTRSHPERSRSPLETGLPSQTLMVAKPTEGRDPATSVPPEDPASGTYSPPAPSVAPAPEPPRRSPRSLKKRAFSWGVKTVPRLLRAAGRVDLNRLTDPNAPLQALHTGTLPTPVETIEEGVRRSLAHHSIPQLDSIASRLRRDLEHLEAHGLSRTRELYLQVEANRQLDQQAERKLLAPILPIYRRLVTGLESRCEALDVALESYETQARKILGTRSGLTLADALIDLDNVMRARTDRRFRSSLTDGDLESLGYNPAAPRYAAANDDVFIPGTIQTVLSQNDFLGQSTGAAELRQAAQHYDETAAQCQTEIRKLVDRLRPLEIEEKALKKAALEENASRLAAIEAEKTALDRSITELEQRMHKAGDPLEKALGDFLTDSERAHVWTLEIALQASVRAWLHESSGANLEKIVQKAIDDGSKPESRPPGITEKAWHDLAIYNYRLGRATRELQKQKNQAEGGGIRGPVDLAAKIVGKRDYRALWKAMGAYEAAAIDIFVHYENILVPAAIQLLSKRLVHWNTGDRDDLIAARQAVRGDFAAMGRWAGELLAEMAPHARAFFQDHEARTWERRAEGMRVGWCHVEELFAKLETELEPAKFQAEIAPHQAEIRRQFEETMEAYAQIKKIVLRGKQVNPRDINRRAEGPVREPLSRAYRLLESTVERAGLKWGDVPRIIPLYENYTLPWELRRCHSGSDLFRYIGPALPRMAQVFSAERHGYPHAIITRRFLDYGRVIGEEVNSQIFYRSNHLSRISRYFGSSISGTHFSHMDFIGHSTLSVQAAHGLLADDSSSPDMIAKFDLEVPVLDQVFPYLVNFVGNRKGAVRAAEVRGVQIQSFGYPAEHRLARMNPLMYDAITMAVATSRGPLVGEVHEPVNESWQPIGRIFHVNEGVAAGTGRLSGITLETSPGAVRNFPNQHEAVISDNPTSHTQIMIPANAFPEPVDKAGKTARLDIERMLWHLQAYQPELNPPAPATYKVYEEHAQPTDLSVERQVAQLLAGAEELYPTRAGIQELEAKAAALRRTLESDPVPGSETTSQPQNDLELLQRVLDVQTRRLLRRRLQELELRFEGESWEGVDSSERKGVRRLHRIIRARIKLLDRVEAKLAKGQDLDLTERRFVERAGTAIAGRANVSGRDHLLEQLDHYFELRDQGRELKPHLLGTQNAYYDFVRQWNERRRDPTAAEYSQIHVSEAQGYDAVWEAYRKAIETTLNVYGVTPRRWKGELIPDIVFRREGSTFFIEPRDWKPGKDFSRRVLWNFLLDDTTGSVSVARRLPEFDKTPNLYSTLHARLWAWRMLQRTQTRFRLEQTENLREVGAIPLIVAPTHDSGIEFSSVPSVLHDYGIQAFFMADDKFFASFWAWKKVSLGPLNFRIPYPKPPAFGIIRALLGPMENYGHLSIDRSDIRSAIKSMEDTGPFINKQRRSPIIFPGATRNPIQYDADGNRYEGDIYGSKPGIAMAMKSSQAPILPIGLKNGGVIFPKQNGDAYLRGGAALGREYVFNFGQPLLYERIVPGNPAPEGLALRNAVPAELNRQFAELTGRKVGPPAPSKTKMKKSPAKKGT